MAEPSPITVPALAAAARITGGEQVPVHQNGQLKRVDPSDLVGDVLPRAPVVINGRSDTIAGHIEGIALEGAGARVTRTTAEPIADWRAVYIDHTDLFRLADARDPDLFGRTIGIVAVGGDAGAGLSATTLGDIEGPAAGFTPGDTLVVGADGVLTPNLDPDAAWRQPVATVAADGRLVVALGEASLIETGDVLLSSSGVAVPATALDLQNGTGEGYLRPDVVRGELDRILARYIRPESHGLIADARIAADGTLAQGTDRTGNWNAWSAACRDVSARPLLPRGPGGLGYLILGTAYVYDDGDYRGEIIAPCYDTQDPIVRIAPDPADVIYGTVADVKSWTGLFQGSARIGNLGFTKNGVKTLLKGHYLTVKTRDEAKIGRAPTASDERIIRQGQGTYVNTDLGRIAHPLDSSWRPTGDSQNTSGSLTIAAGTVAYVGWRGHGLPAGTAFRFVVPATTPAGQLPAPTNTATTYYVVSPFPNAFAFATSPGGTLIALTSAGSGRVQILVDRSFPATVSTATSLITKAAHGLTTGAPFRVDSTGTIAAPLNGTDTFYATTVSTDAFGAALTPDDAAAGNALTLTSAGTGQHTIIPFSPGDVTLGMPAAVASPGHILAENCPIRLGTSGLLPAPFNTAETFFAVNVTLGGYSLARTPFGLGLTQTAAGSGAHTYVASPRYAWEWTEAFDADGKPIGSTEIMAQRVRQPISVSGLRIALYRPSAGSGLTPAPRNKIITVNRCNTTLNYQAAANRSGLPIAQGIHIEECCSVTVNDAAVNDLLNNGTNYSVALGATCDVTVNATAITNCRRSLDMHNAIGTTIVGGCYPDGIGCHWAVGTTLIGLTGGSSINCFHMAGADLAILGCRLSLLSENANDRRFGVLNYDGRPAALIDRRANFFNLREDIPTFSGVVYADAGTVLDIDTTGSTSDPVLVNLGGPTDGFDTYRNAVMPAKIQINATVRMRGAEGRNLQLLRYLRDYDATFNRSIKAPRQIAINCVVLFDDEDFVPADGRPRCRITYRNSQTNTGDCQIRVRNVRDLYVIALPGSNNASPRVPMNDKGDGRASFDIDVPGPVTLDLRGGGFKRCDVKCSGEPEILPQDATWLVGDEEIRPGEAVANYAATQARLDYVNANQVSLRPVGAGYLWIAGANRKLPPEVSIPNSGFLSSTFYYIYAFMDGSNNVALHGSTTGYVLHPLKKIPVKSGETYRTLVGMVYTATSSGVFLNQPTDRLVASYYNRRPRTLVGASASPTTTSTASIELSTAQRVRVVTWDDEVADLGVVGFASNGTAGASVTTTIGVDDADAGQGTAAQSDAAGAARPVAAQARLRLSEGMHTVSPRGSVSGGAGTFQVRVIGSVG